MCACVRVCVCACTGGQQPVGGDGALVGEPVGRARRLAQQRVRRGAAQRRRRAVLLRHAPRVTPRSAREYRTRVYALRARHRAQVEFEGE